MCAFMFLLLAPHTKNARVRMCVLFVIGSTKKTHVYGFFVSLAPHKERTSALFVFIGTTHKKTCTVFFSFHTTPPRCECIFEVLDTTREVLSVKC